MIIGYARVPSGDQNLDAQTDALKAAGVGKDIGEIGFGIEPLRSRFG